MKKNLKLKSNDNNSTENKYLNKLAKNWIIINPKVNTINLNKNISIKSFNLLLINYMSVKQ